MFFRAKFKSGIPIPIHVEEAKEIKDLTPDFIEAAVAFMVVLDELAMSSVTEGSVGRVLAVAEFVVSTLGHVELDGPAAGHVGVAAAVAVGVVEGDAARAPVVHLALLQICIVGEPTCVEYFLPEMKGMLGGLYLPSR